MKRKKLTLPKVTMRQHAAILAALRLAQQGMTNDAFQQMPHFVDMELKPLSADEIDKLCEALNDCD